MVKNDGACGALVSEVVAAHLGFASHCGAKWLCGRLRGLSRCDASDLLLGATLATTDDK
jgi:hypothetical protein